MSAPEVIHIGEYLEEETGMSYSFDVGQERVFAADLKVGDVIVRDNMILTVREHERIGSYVRLVTDAMIEQPIYSERITRLFQV